MHRGIAAAWLAAGLLAGTAQAQGLDEDALIEKMRASMPFSFRFGSIRTPSVPARRVGVSGVVRAREDRSEGAV